MKTSLCIDRAGRVVIPKEIRDELELQPGDSLELQRNGDSLVLTPSRATVPLVKEGGIWTYQGTGGESIDINRLIDQVREERISDLLK